MSLLLKSKQNINAFRVLKEHGAISASDEHKCHSPAVHCCYYSCFQVVIHILKEFYSKEYEGVDKDIRGHNNQINTFVGEIKSVLGPIEVSTVRRSLTQLKTLRSKSDYAEELVTSEDLEKAEGLMENFHRVIQEKLGL